MPDDHDLTDYHELQRPKFGAKEYATYLNNNIDKYDERMVKRGLLADRPAASGSGRVYVATDSGSEAIYLDTGSWVDLVAGGGSGGTTDDSFHATTDGSATSPTFSWDNDTDTGLYLSSVGVFSVTTAGVEALTIDASQVVDFANRPTVSSSDVALKSELATAFSDGTAGAPAFSWDTDSDTGLYLSATDALTLVTGGVEAYTVDASQVTDFDNRPTVNGSDIALLSETGGGGGDLSAGSDGSASSPVFTWDADSDMGLYRNGADQLSASTGGTEAFTIGAGQVTDFANRPTVSGSDLALLSETGTSADSDGTVSSPAFTWDADTDTGLYRSASDSVSLTTGATEAFTVDAGQVTDFTIRPTVNGTNVALTTETGTTSPWSQVSRSTDYSPSDDESVWVDASGSAVTITLPTPAASVHIRVVAVDATNTVTVARDGSESINGEASDRTLAEGVSETYESDGNDWWVV